MTEDERTALENIPLTKALTVKEGGSTFMVRSAPIASLQEVRQAYLALLLDPVNLASTHNIAGYVLPNGSTGYADDHDYGMGRAIMQATQQAGVKGMVVFITRQYGGQKLGFKRFQIVKDITTRMLVNLAPASQPKDAKPSSEG